MSNPHKPAEPSPPDDELLDLVEQVTELSKLDDHQAINLLLEQHPRHSHRLRQLLPTLAVLADMGDRDGQLDRMEKKEEFSAQSELGDFRIIRELGRGGMGIVFEAEQLSLGRRVALKVLPFATILDDRQLQRFKNEARAAAMLKHPNIVSVYSVGCERGVHFYAMELIDGPSLADVISALQHSEIGNRGSQSATVVSDSETAPLAALSTHYSRDNKSFYRNVAKLGMEASRALHYAHQKNVIHRDIKPSNLLLEPDGNINIADFGLARIQSDDGLTLTGDMIGTLRYMSPQQVEGHFVDERTDIYSLGITLYELIALHPAFPEHDRPKLLRAISEHNPTSLKKFDSHIPRDLLTIIGRCCEREPDARYRTAHALADDLMRFLEHRPIKARPASPLRQAARWMKRRPGVSALIAITASLLVFLAVAGPISVWRQNSLVLQLEQRLYDSSIVNASDAIRKGDMNTASDALSRLSRSRHFHRFRGFEYGYLLKQTRAAEDATQLRWSSQVFCVRQSPRMQSEVAFCTWAGDVTMLNRETRETRPFGKTDRHQIFVYSVAFFHRSPHLASAGLDRSVKIWNEESGNLERSLSFDKGVLAVAVSPDDRFLAVGFHGLSEQQSGVQVFRVSSPIQGRLAFEQVAEHQIPRAMVVSLSFSSDSQFLAASTGERRPRIWHTASWEEIEDVPAFENLVDRVCFSPTEPTLLAIGTSFFQDEFVTGDVRVLDLHAPDEAHVLLKLRHGIQSIGFSHDGAEIAAGTKDGQVWLVETTGEQPRSIRGHSNEIDCVEFLSDDEHLLTCSRDGTIRQWNRHEFGNNHGTLATIDAGHTTDLAFTRDGRTLLATYRDGKARLWDVNKAKVLYVYDCHVPWLWGGAISPDDQWIAVAGGDVLKTSGKLAVFRVDQPTEPIVLLDGQQAVCDVEFLDNNTVAAAVGAEIRLWNMSTFEEVRRLHGHSAMIWRLASSADRELLGSIAVEDDRNRPAARIWDVVSGECLTSIVNRGRGSLAISPDKQLVAIGGHGLVLYELPSGTEVILPGHSGEIYSVAFSPDGKRLVSAGQDGRAKVWNVDTKACLLTFQMSDTLFAARFSPDGRTLAIGHATPDFGAAISLKHCE